MRPACRLRLPDAARPRRVALATRHDRRRRTSVRRRRLAGDMERTRDAATRPGTATARTERRHRVPRHSNARRGARSQRGHAEDLQGARGGRNGAAADRGGHLGSSAREPRGRPARCPSLHRPSVPRPGGERVRRRPERANDTADAGAEGARAVPARGPARPGRRQRTAEPRADVAATCAAAAQERPARRRRRPRGTERGPVRRTPGTATDACT